MPRPQVQNEAEEVRNVMIKNVEKALDRGDKIETLVDKSALLADQSMRFRRQARSAACAPLLQRPSAGRAECKCMRRAA